MPRGFRKGSVRLRPVNDCHGMHDLRKASDPKSLANKMNIPSTCSKCHNDIYIQYSRGFMLKRWRPGYSMRPTAPTATASTKFWRSVIEFTGNASNISDFVCSNATMIPALWRNTVWRKVSSHHIRTRITDWPVKGGSVKAANCASCHMAHEILPPVT